MVAIISLLFTLSLALLVTRVAAMALMLTGMSREAARFQARSAFTGVGYTTSEAEEVLKHPLRRRIVMLLMLLGNAGIATVVATVMLSLLMTSQSANWWLYGILLSSGLLMLWYVASSRGIERHLNKVIAWVLKRWSPMAIRDYVAILQLEGGFAVSELLVKNRDWLADKTLSELKLPNEGVLVLGIRRGEDGKYVGAPKGDTTVHAGDTLTLYGPIDRIEELDRRRQGRQGDDAHQQAVEVLADELNELASATDEDS